MSTPLFAPDCRAWPIYIIATAILCAFYFGAVTEFGTDNHDAETFRDNARVSEDFGYFFSPDREQITGRPVADLTKWLASLLIGADPALFHLLVVALHALAAVLLARLLERMDADLELGFLAGLLFLVNATHFQAVHHISALDYPLALVFGLAGLLSYLRYEREERGLHLAGTYVFLAFGVLSHMAIAGVGPVCLYWSWRQGRPLGVMLRRLVPLGALLGALVLYALHITPKATSTWAALEYYGQSEVSPLNALRLLAWFSGRLFSTAHWLPFPVYKQQPWEIYWGAATMAALALLSWKKPPLALWSAWIVCGLLPFLFVPEDLIARFFPEGPSRYLYLASAGSSVLLAWGLRQLAMLAGKWSRPVGAVALVLLLGSSYHALKRVEGFAHYTSGRHHIAADRVEEGTQKLRRAIAQGDDAIPLRDAYLRLSMALLYLDRDARQVAAAALERFPDDLMLGGIAAVLDGEDPRTRDRGYQWLQNALNRATASGLGEVFKQHLSAVYVNLGKGYLRRQEPARAVDALVLARKLAPARPQIAAALGNAYAALARYERQQGRTGVEALQKALEADPQNGEARKMLEALGNGGE